MLTLTVEIYITEDKKRDKVGNETRSDGWEQISVIDKENKRFEYLL
jgi:hypothetical protein